MESTPSKKKFYLMLSLCANLGLLYIFKYLNFSVEIARNAVEFFTEASLPKWHYDIILPVGISFYTFQTLSYTLDVFFGKRKSERNLKNFALYVSFFPQLVAGPIERSTHLLPEFYKNYDFNYNRVVNGLLLFTWGLFLKVALADRLAPLVDVVFQAPENYKGFQLILASYFFSFQIYGDFGGYSLMAIGCAQILGFELMKNFQQPYLSRSVTEFWKRWHISLSTWFKDYLYIPLGGNRVSNKRNLLNIAVVFIVSGIWHGANYTFIIWGIIHATLVILHHLLSSKIKKFKLAISTFNEKLFSFLSLVFTFHIVTFAWIYFRASNLNDANYIARNLFSDLSFSQITKEIPFKLEQLISCFVVMACVVLVDIFSYRCPNLRHKIMKSPAYVRWSIYISLVLMIMIYGQWTSLGFIYFQF